MRVALSLFPLASLKAGEFNLTKDNPQTWIVTGSKGIGKTTFCQSLAQELRKYPVSVGGILSLAQFQDGVKTGICVQNLATGETKLLGRSTPHVDYFIAVGRWYFNEDVLHWGNRCLLEAAGCDVVIFDECGILEMLQGGGFTSGLTLIDQQRFGMGVVVVRPSLVEMALRRWPGASVIDLEGVTG